MRSLGKNEKSEKVPSGLGALFHKELTDHLESKRFTLVFLLMFLAAVMSLAGAISTIQGESLTSSDYIFLRFFTTSSESIYSFATFMAFLGPLMGIALGFDAINNERSLGTLNRLASQPIHRDAIITAKFLAGSAAIAIVVAFLGLAVSGMGVLVTGTSPSLEEALRLAAFLVVLWAYISFWLALATLFSVVCRHAATAALSAIAIWLFLTLFMSLAASGLANLLFPTDGMEGMLNLMSNYSFELGLNRISPYYLFSEAAVTILNPSVRSIGIVTTSQLYGAVDSYLPLGQSLLLIWPHLVVITALVIVLFAVAYIAFMRQEIRA